MCGLYKYHTISNISNVQKKRPTLKEYLEESGDGKIFGLQQ